MIFVESSRDACLSFDECYEICFRQNCTFSFALFVHFHLTFTMNYILQYKYTPRHVQKMEHLIYMLIKITKLLFKLKTAPKLDAVK